MESLYSHDREIEHVHLSCAAHDDVADPRDQIDLFILIEAVLEDDVTYLRFLLQR